MKQALSFVLFFIFSSCFGISSRPKYIIGSIPAGFFANFNGVINNLDWCHEHSVTPVVYWSDKSFYFVPEGYNGSIDPWEYYFEPVSHEKYTGGETIHRTYAGPGGCGLIPSVWCIVKDAQRRRAKFLIDSYIKLKPAIQKKIDDFYDTHMRGRYTIGIHLRGTDKMNEVRSVKPERMVAEAQKHAMLVRKNCQYLVASDEKRLLEFAKKHLNNNVIFYDAYRSPDTHPLHYRSCSPAQHGEEVLIEAQLLARCNYFIHTVSNVAGAIRLFNPGLQGTCLQ